MKHKPPSPLKPIQYQRGNTKEYGLLRLALVQAWNFRCYWCTGSGDQSAFEIDHLVPEKRASLGISAYDLPAGFDFNGLENLAPICAANSMCNQRKSDAVFPESGNGLILTALESARRKVAGVQKHMQSIKAASGAHALLISAVSEPLDESTRGAFRENAHLLSQRLYEVDPESPETYLSTIRHRLGNSLYMGEFPEHFAGDPQEVRISLDKRARESVVILEQVGGIELAEFLESAVEFLIDEIDVIVDENQTEYEEEFQITGPRSITFTEWESDPDDPFNFSLGFDYNANYCASTIMLDENGQVSNDTGSIWVDVSGASSLQCDLNGVLGEILTVDFESGLAEDLDFSITDESGREEWVNDESEW